MATTMGAISLGNLHAKSVARAKNREKKAIGEMASPDVVGYLCYRHRYMLMTTACIATNLYWITRFYHQ